MHQVISICWTVPRDQRRTANENVSENAEGPNILLLAAVPSSFQDFRSGKAVFVA